MSKTKTFNVGGVKKTYRQGSCHTSKGAARSVATAVRARGKTARVVKNGTSFCVYIGAKKRKAAKK